MKVDRVRESQLGKAEPGLFRHNMADYQATITTDNRDGFLENIAIVVLGRGSTEALGKGTESFKKL